MLVINNRLKLLQSVETLSVVDGRLSSYTVASLELLISFWRRREIFRVSVKISKRHSAFNRQWSTQSAELKDRKGVPRKERAALPPPVYHSVIIAKSRALAIRQPGPAETEARAMEEAKKTSVSESVCV